MTLHRSGGTSQELTVDLQLGGTAVNGEHVELLPEHLTIAAGQSTRELPISARAAGLAAGPKVLLVLLASRDHYLSGDPHEALIYVGNTTLETQGAGFERWLQATSHGTISTHADLRRLEPDRINDYLQAYAFGLGSVEDLGTHGISLRIVDGRPELRAPGQFKAADLRWGVQAAAALGQWSDAGATFSQVPDPAGLKLVGQPLDTGDRSKFYRLNLTLDPGQLAGDTIAAITGNTSYGISGNGNDSLVLYIDGVRQAETQSAPARFQQSLTNGETHLFMWEFTCGSGKADIRYKEQFLTPRLKELDARPVNESRLRELYRENEPRFRSNEKRQVAVLWLNPNGDPERTAQYLEKLNSAREWATTTELKDHSEHAASRHKGGIVGWLESAGGIDPWTKAVAEIAFSLQQPGDVSQAISRPEGLFLVRLMAQNPAVLRPFESVARELEQVERQRLRQEIETRFQNELDETHAPQVTESKGWGGGG